MYTGEVPGVCPHLPHCGMRDHPREHLLVAVWHSAVALWHADLRRRGRARGVRVDQAGEGPSGGLQRRREPGHGPLDFVRSHSAFNVQRRAHVHLEHSVCR